MNTSTPCTADLAPQREQVQIGDITLSYLEWQATGSVLVLLHGITSSARTWWRVAPPLAKLGYHVYAFDMPGHGQSSAVDTHRIEQIAALIQQAIQVLSIECPTVIGHSWGGATALALANQIDLDRLVLIDPLLAYAVEVGVQRLDDFLAGVGLPPEQTLPKLRTANPGWQECDFIWKAEALEQCRAEAVRGLFTASGDWNLIPQLGHLDIPLLLLFADPAFSIMPPAFQAQIAQTAQPELAKIMTLPGTDHNIFRGGFEAFMHAVIPWFGAA